MAGDDPFDFFAAHRIDIQFRFNGLGKKSLSFRVSLKPDATLNPILGRSRR